MIAGIIAQGAAGGAAPVGGLAKLSALFSSPNVTLSGADLTATHGGTDSVRRVIATMDAKGAGKWYCEVTVSYVAGSDFGVSVGNFRAPLNGDYLGRNTQSILYHRDGRVLYNNGNQSGSPGAYVNGDIIGVAVDADAGTIRFNKNGGTWSPAYNPAGGRAFMLMLQFYRNGDTATVNFGDTAFAHTPYTGHIAWTENPPLPAARYWRHHVVLTDGSNNTSVAEMELRATSGGADATGSGTPSSASIFSSPLYTADKAFDNNASTIAHCANNQGAGWWLQYDFGAAQTVVEMSLTVRNDILQYPSEFHLGYSDDNSIFFPALAKVAEVFTTGQTKVYTFG